MKQATSLWKVRARDCGSADETGSIDAIAIRGLNPLRSSLGHHGRAMTGWS
jgi:hypothetical protein